MLHLRGRGSRGLSCPLELPPTFQTLLWTFWFNGAGVSGGSGVFKSSQGSLLCDHNAPTAQGSHGLGPTIDFISLSKHGTRDKAHHERQVQPRIRVLGLPWPMATNGGLPTTEMGPLPVWREARSLKPGQQDHGLGGPIRPLQRLMVAAVPAGWAGGWVAPICLHHHVFPVCMFLCPSPGEVTEHTLFWPLVAGT